MPRIKYLVAVVAVGSLSAGLAAAASQSSSETTPVTADFRASLVSVKERPCDATHTTFKLRFEGTQTSADARLTGALVAKARSVVNNQNGYGYTSGKVRVADAAGGRPKFGGRFAGVIEPGGGIEGFIIGRTVGRPSVKLVANFNAQQDAAGALAGELGKDGQGGPLQDPAILTSGCRGGHGKRGDDDRGKGHRRKDDDDR